MHLIVWVSLQEQCWVVSYTPPWHRLDWSIMQVIMIAWLHAMYQRSRMVLIFIVVIFLAIRITDVVILAILTMQISGGKLSSFMNFQVHQAHWQVPVEYILSSTYLCMIDYTGDFIFMDSMISILDTVWEVLTLCLVVWIAVKHPREPWQHVTLWGEIITWMCYGLGWSTPTKAIVNTNKGGSGSGPTEA